MDELLFHPKVVHVPIALAVLMPLIAGGMLVAWWRDWLPRRTWIVVVALQAMLVGSAWVSLETGEDQEDAVEKFVPEGAIDAHEDAANWFLWGSALVLVLLAVPVVVSDARGARLLALVGTVGTLVVFAMGYRVGHLGGELVYRHGAARAYETSAPPGP